MQLAKKKDWTEDEKYFSLSLYYKSPTAYVFLKSRGFKLPSVSTIRRWVNVCNLQSGFVEEVFVKLRLKAESMTEDEKQFVLFYDEMGIKKEYVYSLN